ncbi:hypothetical protein LCGC14_0411020 [marine sediment metagenome]|uniref:Uncharacterized protein n=1 Tax=marine sediment metagenome TaxID=412755 RepID=A0A0F9VFQ1_9ZZZZ
MKTNELRDLLETIVPDLSGVGDAWHFDSIDRDRRSLGIGASMRVEAWFDPQEKSLNGTALEFVAYVRKRMAQQLLVAARELATGNFSAEIDKVIDRSRDRA